MESIVMKNIKIRESINTGKLRQVSSNVSGVKDYLRRVRYDLGSVENSYTLQSEFRESERLLDELEHRVDELIRLKARSVEDLYQLDRYLARHQGSEWHRRKVNQSLDKYRGHNNYSRLDWILNTKAEWIKNIASILGVTAGQAVLGIGAGRYIPEKMMDLEGVSHWIGHQLSSQFDDDLRYLNVPMNISPVASAFQFVKDVVDKIPKCYDPSKLIDSHPELIFYIPEQAMVGMPFDKQMEVKKFKSAWQDYVGAGAVELGVIGGLGVATKQRLNHLADLKPADWTSHEKSIKKAKKKKGWLESAWDGATGAVSDAWDSTTDFVGGAVEATGNFIDGAWTATTSFAGGVGDSVVGTVSGIWNMVTNPIDTVKGIGNAVLHPVQTGKAIWTSVSTSFNDNIINGNLETRSRFLGMVVGEVALSLVSAKGLDKVSKLDKVNDAAKILNLVEDAEDVVKIVDKVDDATDMVKVAGLGDEVSDTVKVLDKVEDGVELYYKKNLDDPIRDVIGSGVDSNPNEWKAIIDELQDEGVEVVYRKDTMAYSPAPSPGRKGQLFIDPDASYSALVHEYQHYLDDLASGFPGMKQMFEKNNRIVKELRAYMKEIKIADELGLKEVSSQLWDNYRKERANILGIFNE